MNSSQKHSYVELVSLIDNCTLRKLALRCNHLIESFRGFWSADFSRMHHEDASPSFQIVNTETIDKPGKHWILLRKRTNTSFGFIIFWDSLGKKTQKKNCTFG